MCGDGVLSVGEECDDGNTLTGDLLCYGGPDDGDTCVDDDDCGSALQSIGLALSEQVVDNDTTVSRNVTLKSTGHKRLFLATAVLENGSTTTGRVTAMTFNGVAMTQAAVATSSTSNNTTCALTSSTSGSPLPVRAPTR